MTLILIVLLVLVGGGVWFVVRTYNNLISLIKQVENAKGNIDRVCAMSVVERA